MQSNGFKHDNLVMQTPNIAHLILQSKLYTGEFNKGSGL